MATYTTNYNLKKPDTTDLVDVADLNDNADIIDAALAGKEDTLTFDNTPTANSTNPVTSGGIYIALQNAGVKEYTLTAACWDESQPYMWINQNATDNRFVWLYATADLTAEGQPLHNAILTGIEVSSDGTTWTDLSADRNLDYQPTVPSKPWLITETTDDFGTCTAVVYGNKSTSTSSGLFNALYIKIHFIKYTDGGAV